jgi:predicted acetyltransferase
MDIEVRAIAESELPDYGRSLGRAFNEDFTAEDWEVERTVMEFDRTLAAFDGTDMVGTTGAFPLILTIPGGSLPMAGVTQVSVLPTHRRRGVLTQMMRTQLDDIRERGELVAGLWASESSIYGRFGYGIATLCTAIEIERSRTAFAHSRQSSGRVWLAEKDAALEHVPDVYDRATAGWPGTLRRPANWWRRITADLEHWRDGATRLYYALHDSGEGVDGYVLYRVKQDWGSGFGSGIVKVREVMATSLAAYADLWQYCFGIDLIAKIEAWPRPLDDPLQYLLAEPRRLNMRVADAMWIRLVDVPAALAARRYAAPGQIVLDVRDAFCAWNEGRYELDAGPGGATCRPTTRDADLTLDAADLGGTYLGGVRFGALARGGRVEGDAAALTLADGMFGWDRPPFCPNVF